MIRRIPVAEDAKTLNKSIFSPAFLSDRSMFLLQKGDKLLYSPFEFEQEQVEVQANVSHLLIYVRMTERRMVL